MIEIDGSGEGKITALGIDFLKKQEEEKSFIEQTSDQTVQEAKNISRSEAYHVFIAYRSGNKSSEDATRKIKDYLQDRHIPVWFFENKVAWSDSITNKEEAIENSFAAIICYTLDFLQGKIARQEYDALQARKRENEKFRLGLLLISCEHKDVPALSKDLWSLNLRTE